MEPAEAVADHARLVRALAARRACDPMVAWALARARPACLDPRDVRPLARPSTARQKRARPHKGEGEGEGAGTSQTSDGNVFQTGLSGT